MFGFVVLNMVHVLLGILHFMKGDEESLSPKTQYIFYIDLEILACFTFVMAKITQDLFVELNRDKSILVISILQKDYLAGVDLSRKTTISVNGDHMHFKDQIDQMLSSRRLPDEDSAK